MTATQINAKKYDAIRNVVKATPGITFLDLHSFLIAAGFYGGVAHDVSREDLNTTLNVMSHYGDIRSDGRGGILLADKTAPALAKTTIGIILLDVVTIVVGCAALWRMWWAL